MTDHDPWQEEEDRSLRKLRLMVDITAQVLAEDRDLTLCTGLRLIEALRTTSQRLFPANHSTFELVIRPRLERILLERFGLDAGGAN
jgi:hypothetical protein